MVPRLTNQLSWQQAELLMQPALLRVVDNIRKQLEVSDWKGSYEDVELPIPGHQLCLECHNQQVKVNVWELCFQVCFRDYQPTIEEKTSQEVEIDTALIDAEGEVDWQQLEAKTQQLIAQLFQNLPSASSPSEDA